MEIRFDVSQLEGFAETMNAAPARLKAELTESSRVALNEGVGYAMDNAPVDTGSLKNSIRILEGPTSEGGTYGSDLDYAWMREEGGTITARKAKALAFEYQGHLVMVKSVTQTGSHYMKRSKETLEPRVGPIMELAVDRALGLI